MFLKHVTRFLSHNSRRWNEKNEEHFIWPYYYLVLHFWPTSLLCTRHRKWWTGPDFGFTTNLITEISFKWERVEQSLSSEEGGEETLWHRANELLPLIYVSLCCSQIPSANCVYQKNPPEATSQASLSYSHPHLLLGYFTSSSAAQWPLPTHKRPGRLAATWTTSLAAKWNECFKKPHPQLTLLYLTVSSLLPKCYQTAERRASTTAQSQSNPKCLWCLCYGDACVPNSAKNRDLPCVKDFEMWYLLFYPGYN